MQTLPKNHKTSPTYTWMSCIDQNMFLIQTQTLIKRAPDFKLLKVGQYWGWLSRIIPCLVILELWLPDMYSFVVFLLWQKTNLTIFKRNCFTLVLRILITIIPAAVLNRQRNIYADLFLLPNIWVSNLLFQWHHNRNGLIIDDNSHLGFKVFQKPSDPGIHH